jgi:hypothetical protein
MRWRMFAHPIAISKNVHSVAVARLRVITRPRPIATFRDRQLPHCERFKDSAGVTFDVPFAVEARRPSTIVAEAGRLVPMAQVPSLHIPSIPVRSIPVRSISIGSVPVPSPPVRPVPIRSTPILIAVLSPETVFHMKTTRAAFMKSCTSSSDSVRPRQEDAGEANSSDGDNCSRGHQLNNSKRDELQANRTALSLPQSANSTASPNKTGAMVKNT